MKDGRTHLAHKAEHAVDMDSGATLAVTVQPADKGDTQTVGETLSEVAENLGDVNEQRIEDGDEPLRTDEAVMDKGYHSDALLCDLEEAGIRGYVSEPKRPRRCWKDRQAQKRAVYGNRRRIRGERGKALLRKRGELLERSFAHHYRTGAMRRTHLRGHEKIHKRLLIHSAGSNLALLMRSMFGIGKPKGLEGAVRTAFHALLAMITRMIRSWAAAFGRAAFTGWLIELHLEGLLPLGRQSRWLSSTGC